MQAEDRLSEWMRRYQEGDSDVLAELYRAVASGMLNYLYRLSQDRALAEDMLQEVFLRIHKVRHAYRPESPVRPWLYAIARYVCMATLRKGGRRREFAYEEALVNVAPPDSVDHTELSEDLKAVERALAELPAGQREAFVLTKVAGLSVQEASAVLGISEGAIKVKVHRALRTVRDLLNRSQTGQGG